MTHKVHCRNIYGEQSFCNADDLNFRPSVYAVIIRDEKVLLSRQWDGYDFPGGGINKGERIFDALQREVYEEAGVTVNNGILISCTDDFFISPKDGTLFHSILIYYACDQYTGEPNINHLAEDEKSYISGFEWVDMQTVDTIKFYNGVDSVAMIKKAYELLQRK